jgi:hypothetical protein
VSIVGGQLVVAGAQVVTATAPDGGRALVVVTQEGLQVVVPMGDAEMTELGRQLSAPRVIVPTGADVAQLNGRG